MSNKDIQIRLRGNVAHEKEIIDYINNAGKNSGIPKQLLLAGYAAMVKGYQPQVQTVQVVKEPEPEPEPEEPKKPSVVIKGMDF